MKFQLSKKDNDMILEQLYANYCNLIYHVAYSILNDHVLAEDAVQTVFIKLLEYNFEIDSVFCNKTKAFLVIITRNISISLYNQKKRVNMVYDEGEVMQLADDQMPLLDFIVSDEGFKNILNIISTLDPKYADIFLMRYHYDHPISQIAFLFGLSEQLVRVRLHRTRRMLIDKLNEEHRR